MTKVPIKQLGRDGPLVSSIGLGTMSICPVYGETDQGEVNKALTLAADLGMTFWDCADVYGNAEEALGKWFTGTGRRNEIFLCTKFGSRDLEDTAVPAKRNSKPAHIRRALKKSLANLKTDHIDLYFQHRVDVTVPVEIVVQTLGEFIESGQIKWIGFSECGIDTLRRAKAVPKYGEKVIALQTEYSPLSLDVEKNGILETTRALGMAFIAYSPLSRGLIGGDYRTIADLKPNDFRSQLPRFTEENLVKNAQLNDKIRILAANYDATAAQIILAWILAEHPDVIPIPGSRSRARVKENAAAAHINLADEDIKAIRDIVDAVEVHGDRYSEQSGRDIGSDTLPLDQWKGE